MKKRKSIFQKSGGISPYIWTFFSILPFYFVFQSTDMTKLIVGIVLTILFYIVYRFAFLSKGWPVYLWTSILIGISVTMTILFSFIYFAFFIAYYNGHIKNRVAFLTLYILHLIATTFAINYLIVLQEPFFLKQIPFILIIWISVILMPFNIHNKKKQDELENKLEDANKRIAELVKQEERQRIARDLHDTLGQKLSLIGLKSDLARKIIYKDPEKSKNEMKDVQETARTALNEVRKMVSQMRGIRLKDELANVQQILEAAEIDFLLHQNMRGKSISLFVENILSMCMKEAVTNVVKHSQATQCQIIMEQSLQEVCITIKDNGIGFIYNDDIDNGNGLLGIKERLEFVNGNLDVVIDHETAIVMKVPHVIKKENEGGF